MNFKLILEFVMNHGTDITIVSVKIVFTKNFS